MTADEIVGLRKKLKMTQQELANALGVDRVTVARWETGRGRPSNLARRQLARLANKSK
ncbi:MAG: helix-turn-helix domain-containing protein [Deltaproteobacteria bacterium]|nr:helix-turn-helix domain-containing protein [Deltaproteobacteria bacterium]